jgi:hypothetical protein
MAGIEPLRQARQLDRGPGLTTKRPRGAFPVSGRDATWSTIAANAFTAVEIARARGTSARFTLYTGGVRRQTITTLNTKSFTLEAIRMGPQGTLTDASGHGVLRLLCFHILHGGRSVGTPPTQFRVGRLRGRPTRTLLQSARH